MKKSAFPFAANAQDTSVIVTDTYNNNKDVSNTKNFIWSIGIVHSIPIGHFNDLSGFGLRGSFQGEYKPGNKKGIMANAGCTGGGTGSGGTGGGYGGHYSTIDLRLGINF